MGYEITELSEGIKLHKINTNKFKTNLISIFLTTKLDRKDITKKSLILSLLKRGTSNLRSQEEINAKLEDLYGAEFNSGIDKLGNNHIMKFYIESISDDFAYQKYEILKQSIDLLFDIVFNPLIEENQFKYEYFEGEKQKLQQIIEAKKDNKSHYSYTRCIEEMYKDEPYGLYSYGYLEDLENITNEDLYATYLELLKKCKIDIFISGNLEGKKEIDEIVNNNIRKSKLLSRKVEELYLENSDKKEVEEKVVKESMDVAQGKLVIGLDVLNCNKEDKLAVSVYNTILGGGANSKLFQNVREKASLAYSAGSMYIKNKNNIIIRSGIEHKNYDKAVEIIKKQIEDMKNGEFSEKDIKDAKELIIASFVSMQDEQDSEISFYFGREMEQSKNNVEENIKEIEHITKEKIIEIAKKIRINTIYFLTK